jgi:hypothetical protein
MLKLILASTAMILCIAKAQAQTPNLPPGYYGNGVLCGMDAIDCQHRLEDRGMSTDQYQSNSYGRDTYQPYPDSRTMRPDPFDHTFDIHHRGYGNDDED